MNVLMELTIAIIEFLQTQTAWLTPVMRFFTFLGDEEFYLLIMPVFLWSIDYSLGMRLGVMLMASNSINFLLKILFRQPRPYWVSQKVKNLTAPAGSFGPPSGHTQNATTLFGLLAASMKKNWLRGVLVFTIFMVGLSRLFLGVHALMDVLLGFIMGGLLLWVFIKVEGKVVEAFNRQTIPVQILLAFGFSVTLALLGVLLVHAYRDFSLPSEWIRNAQAAHPGEALAPFSLDGLTTSTGVLFGLIAGNVWVREKGGYRANSGSLPKHILRFIIGLAGVVFIWRYLFALLPAGGEAVGQALRYMRYALIGLWISGLAPVLFVRLKLATK